MAKKLKALAEGASDGQLATTIRNSAQQIWLAGLGAFAKAQEEGAKVFEALVKEGKTLEGRTRKIAEARVSAVSGQWGKAATEATAKAGATWDKLEQVFETRVARALGRLGVPTKRDLEGLAERVEELTASIQKLAQAKPRAAARKSIKRSRKGRA
jgi:poly(hydroxyalkanoate) granule-associated protein